LTAEIVRWIVYYMSSELLKQTITFELNQTSGVPAYLQIVQQVEQALRMGALQPGDQLPTAKQVVAEVAINPNTVMKAYRELEHAGLVEGRQGVGTFVLRRPQGPPPEEQIRLAQGLGRWIGKARAAGLDDRAMEEMLRSLLRGAADRGVA
jgi:GntR family transcriptional regulator